MIKTPFLTILTPTYNRKDKLPRLYESLCAQTSKNFEWLVIDDGSTDKTEDYILSLLTDKFPIHYHKKHNDGKHTALNFAHPYIQGQYVAIVDSDDWLVPNAVETILKDWENCLSNKEIAVISYLKQFSTGTCMTKVPTWKTYLSNHIDYRINQTISGDQFEVVRSEIFTSYLFPVFPQERYVPEGNLWLTIASNYQTLYITVPLYKGDYLTDGLTKSGRTLRIKNPLGMMSNCKMYFQPRVKKTIQFKKMMLFGTYGLCARLSITQIIKDSGRLLTMSLVIPFSLVLHLYWKKKYPNSTV